MTVEESKIKETLREGHRDKQGMAALLGKPTKLFPGMRTRAGARAARDQAAFRARATCYESRGPFEDQEALTCRGRHGHCSFRLGKHLQLDGAVLTRKSQRCPARLSAAIAQVLINNSKANGCAGMMYDISGGSGGVAPEFHRLGMEGIVVDTDATTFEFKTRF